jgi:hypothetical protein
MKKITMLLGLLFAGTQIDAQVLISQNFDSALTWTVAHPTGTSTLPGWTRVTTGTAPAVTPFAGAGMARFNSYDVAAGNAYSLTSPAITFTGAACKVKFKMYRDNGYNTDADNIKIYINTVASSAGGTLLGTVNRSITLAPTEAANGWYSYSFDVPAGINGTRYISFLATGFYGNNMFIDEVSVNQTLANDAEISSLTLNSIVLPGNASIAGNFKNSGSSTINTADLNWQVDGGAINTQALSGLNLTPGQSYTYNHTTQWTATVGAHSMKVWVSNPNGVVDGDLTNNEITKSISVASGSTLRFPLYEEFSSSTCPPCASFNNSVMNPFHTSNGSEFAMINYRVNWPGAGDPYYTAEVGTRVSYYGVNGAPTLLVDATDGAAANVAGMQSGLAAEKTIPAYFSINSTKTLTGSDITVNVTTTPYLTGTYRLYAAVIEKTTTGNTASNGETSFKDAFMKMLPDASGTILNCVADTPITTSLTANLSGLHIEEMSDLEVVVFVQNYATKEVMQSQKATAALANTQFEAASKIKLFPNPSQGFVKISTDSPVDVIVTDITGKAVYSAKQVTNETTMNLSSLQKGIYLAKIINGDSQHTQKIILK